MTHNTITSTLIDDGVMVDGIIRPRKLLHWVKNPMHLSLLMSATGFLPEYSGPIERAYCVQEDIEAVQTCGVCTSPVSFINGSKGYRQSCSIECGRVNPSTIAARQHTVRERYGVDHFSQSDEFKQSYQSTCMERYGVPDIKCDSTSRIKAKNTMDRLYGGYTLQSELLSAKVRDTMMNAYGAEHPMGNQSIVNKRTRTNIVKYGSPSPQSCPSVKAKSIATMIERYGVQYPMQMPEYRHNYLESSNLNFNRDHWTQTKQSLETTMAINNKQWLINQHHDHKKSISTIAMELGDISVTGLANKFHKFEIDIKLYQRSSLEVMVCDWLDSIGVLYETNNRSIIQPNEIDIVLPDYNVGIEINGLYWHSCVHSHIHPNYHAEKSLRCFQEGISLITIFEDDFRDCTWMDVLHDAIINTNPHAANDERLIVDARYMHVVTELIGCGYIVDSILPPTQYKHYDNVYDCGSIILQTRNNNADS